ncbi:hypothetical protein ACPB0U_23740, partial [Escherichia coli]|uniref:hypothetical protein n=1 Tax=Escherichia coli TaxID=562 RepID=UPI003C3088D7
LTLTSGLGTGINDYIDDTVSAVGASDAMTVTKAQDSGQPFGGDGGPVEYEPDAVATGLGDQTVIALTPEDLTAIERIDGVLDVQAARA